MDEETSFGRRQSGNHRKRSRSEYDNGKRKRQNPRRESDSSSDEHIDTIYRILCPVKKIGSVLGRGGDIINALRNETHAKIRVADVIPRAEERVVIIFSYESQSSGKRESNEDPFSNILSGNELDDMRPHCPAQDALLKVHDKIAADLIFLGDELQEKTKPDDVVTTRLLVPNSQVGCLLGKSGTVIQRLRTDTQATIRILPSDHLPPCAMESDELVQISGVPTVVRRALYAISTLLHNHPRKENPPLEVIISASTKGSQSGSSMPSLSQSNRSWFSQQPDGRVPPTIPWSGGLRDEPPRYTTSNYGRNHDGNGGEEVEFVLRILCATGRIGGVIGKGGMTVRHIEQQTGARIQVEDTAGDAEERVIVVSAKEASWDPISPTIEALLQLQTKTSSISENGVITSRLLVPSSKVGCILGQGGSVITDMRRRTKADIKVLSKDDKPKYISGNEELVQVSGNQNVARDALAEIASRIRARTLRSESSDANPAPPRSFHGLPPERLPTKPSRAYLNSGLDPAPSSHFRGYASPEHFPSRGPQSSMLERGRTVGYDYSKAAGQAHEDHAYPVPSSATRYHGVNSSGDAMWDYPTTATHTAGASSISDRYQVSGARSSLYDPYLDSSDRVSELRGSSDQMRSSKSYIQGFSAYDEQSLPPLQSARRYY